MSAIRVVYLGRLADVAGRAESELVLPSGETGWAVLVAALESQVNADIAQASRDAKVKIAINGTVHTDRDGLQIKPGDEVALLPPVSGG